MLEIKDSEIQEVPPCELKYLLGITNYNAADSSNSDLCLVQSSEIFSESLKLINITASLFKDANTVMPSSIAGKDGRVDSNPEEYEGILDLSLHRQTSSDYSFLPSIGNTYWDSVDSLTVSVRCYSQKDSSGKYIKDACQKIQMVEVCPNKGVEMGYSFLRYASPVTNSSGEVTLRSDGGISWAWDPWQDELRLLFNTVYPVGSIFISFTDSDKYPDKPPLPFVTQDTWTLVAQGRTLRGASDAHPAGSQLGAAKAGPFQCYHTHIMNQDTWNGVKYYSGIIFSVEDGNYDVDGWSDGWQEYKGKYVDSNATAAKPRRWSGLAGSTTSSNGPNNRKPFVRALIWRRDS